MRQTGNGGRSGREDVPNAAFFAIYAGPSMYPTLREKEVLEIAPRDGAPLRAGDVVFCHPSGPANPAVVHRIVRLAPGGIVTRGDNNAREDGILLRPEDVDGTVVAAWRGRKRRRIARAFPGRWTGRILHLRRLLAEGITRLLHPLYRLLSSGVALEGFLPSSLRPRVVAFSDNGTDRFRLLLGRSVIGYYEEKGKLWRIRRPFRLVVDERTLSLRDEP